MTHNTPQATTPATTLAEAAIAAPAPLADDIRALHDAYLAADAAHSAAELATRAASAAYDAADLHAVRAWDSYTREADLADAAPLDAALAAAADAARATYQCEAGRSAIARRAWVDAASTAELLDARACRAFKMLALVHAKARAAERAAFDAWTAAEGTPACPAAYLTWRAAANVAAVADNAYRLR